MEKDRIIVYQLKSVIEYVTELNLEFLEKLISKMNKHLILLSAYGSMGFSKLSTLEAIIQIL